MQHPSRRLCRVLGIKSLDICPLCNNTGNVFYKNDRCLYYDCGVCSAIFLSKDFYLSQTQEKNRYLEHKNDVNDPRYQKFVSPIVVFIQENFIPGKHRGLDFGAGTGPVASKMLQEKGFDIDKYDPFFYPDKSCLNKEYDFILACEVIEHFREPYEEFFRLFELLRKKGKLVFMTSVYDRGINFDSWYYKNDPTHVFIYHKKTFGWIKGKFGFTGLDIDKNLIILSR
jgi:SAM-dependent methyltransferase